MMRSTFAIVTLTGAVVASACELDRTQAPEPARSYLVDEGVSAAATGSGHLVAANGELRKFTFSAITHADGRVSGEFELVAGNADLVAHGTVTCMAVIDDQAWVGGTLDRNSVGAPFTHGWFRAVDNFGSGDPDEISVLVVANNPDGTLAQAFCDDTPTAFPPLNPIEHGSITIR